MRSLLSHVIPALLRVCNRFTQHGISKVILGLLISVNFYLSLNLIVLL